MRANVISNNERWVQIELLNDCFPAYRIELVSEDSKGLQVLLLSVNIDVPQRILFDFGQAFRAHRQTDRRFAGDNLAPAIEQHGSEIFKKCTFFKVVNSRYIQDFVDESYGFVTQDWFTHFVFVGEDFVVDVAACEEPVVEISGRALEVDEDAVL